MIRRRVTLVASAGVAVAAAGLAAAILPAAEGRRPGAGRRRPAAVAGTRDAGIYGFHRGSLAAERRVEAQILELPAVENVERHARVLTSEPHVAGTPENDRVARYIYDRFKEAGLEVTMKSYPVYLGYVTRAVLEQVAPERRVLSNPEDPMPEDEGSADPRARLDWNAYSPSCDLTREVVYANFALPEDFERLTRAGIAVEDRVVLARNFHGYRGGKALEAQRRRAAAIVFYSDPAEDGYVRGDVFPKGPWGPDGHIQRGAAVFDFIVPGDPLTPGWASLPGARRIDPRESEILPRIPSIPISGRDALIILKALEGPVVPRGWQGGLPVTYHLGPGPSRVHLAIDATFETRDITDVIGVLRGRDEPEQKIILGNHHDAWVYGASDPVSGTATMLELARVAGELARRGMRPRRTLVFGSWDAEEWTLTGSTEWGEENREDLALHGVASLNVDSSASGSRFGAAAVPTLRRLLSETLRDVADPRSGRDLYATTAAGASEEQTSFAALYGSAASAATSAATSAPSVTYDILGSGSDYTVFFNHIGMPSLDAYFEGPYGVYHSVYDGYAWMSRFGDPGFLYHTAMVRVWGLLTYRIANADILPFEESPYPADVLAYLSDLEREAKTGGARTPDLTETRAAAGEWQAAAAVVDRSVAEALEGPRPGRKALASANAALMQAERDLLAAAGLPKRPWFRHLIYAPLPTYAAETLPGLREAVAEADAGRAGSQSALLASAFRARAATLRSAAAALAGREEERVSR